MQQLRPYLVPTILVVFIALSAFSLWSQWSDSRRMPDAAEINEINAEIREQIGTDDAVRVLPNWFKDARIGLDGMKLLQTEDLINNLDLAHLDRLFVSYANAFDEHAEAAKDYLTNVEELKSTDRMTLLRGDISLPFEVTWDSVDAIREADVGRLTPDGERSPCTRWLRDAWHCDRFNEWLNVGVRTREIDDTPRTCIAANPREFPEQWSIRWTGVPLGDRVRIRYGYAMWALRAYRGGDLDFLVFINGEEVHGHTLHVDDFGYAYVEVAIGSDAPPVGDIEVRSATEDHFDRFFCFRLQAVRDR